jgi:hypothetical protein
MVIHRGEVHAGGRGDVAHRDRGEALLGEQPFGGI